MFFFNKLLIIEEMANKNIDGQMEPTDHLKWVLLLTISDTDASKLFTKVIAKQKNKCLNFKLYFFGFLLVQMLVNRNMTTEKLF